MDITSSLMMETYLISQNADTISSQVETNKYLKARFAFNSYQNMISSDQETLTVEKLNYKSIYHLIKLTNEKLKNMNENKIKRNYITKVELYAIFLKVGEIENIRQRFQADAYIEAIWEDNSIKGDSFDPDRYWTPDLFIENTIGNIKQDIKYKIVKKNNKTFVCEMRNVKGMFYETLELNDFPLDIQDISITVTTSKSNREVDFEISKENESTVNTDDFSKSFIIITSSY